MAPQPPLQESRFMRDGIEWWCVLGPRKQVVSFVKRELQFGWKFRGMEIAMILKLPTDDDFSCQIEGESAVAFMTKEKS